MKQKLFENIGGNTFKLITEGVEEVNPNVKFVREGLKKVFSAGNKSLSYKKVQGVGLGYIKHVEEAKKTALQEARVLAKEYGYAEDENAQKFVKEEDDTYHRPDPDQDEPQASESKEIRIGQEILRIIDSPGMDRAMETEKGKLRLLAQELIQLHTQNGI